MQDFLNLIKNLIRNVSLTLQSILLYGESHPKSVKSLEFLYRNFEDFFLKEAELNLGIVGEEIFSGKEIFFELSGQVKDFIGILKDKNIDFLRFKRGLNLEELKGFLKSLADKETRGDIFKISWPHIELGRFGEERVLKGGALRRANIVKIISLQKLLYENVKESLVGAMEERGLDFSSLIGTVNQLFALLTFRKESLFLLLNLRREQDYTFIHSLNVAILSMFQAKILGLSPKDISRIALAGLFHDIGKIAIKRKILEKKGGITEGEIKELQSHPLWGSKIILSNPNFDRLAFIVSFEHHLGVDLRGYPKVRFLKRQNLASKIVAVSDIYDALRSRRVYKDVMPLERVYTIMNKEKARLLDSYLVDLFFRNLGVWPPGTLVRLDTQEVALVREVNPQDLFRPKVEVFYDSKGERLEKTFIVDLTEKDKKGNFLRRILREMNPRGEGERFISELLGEAFSG
ncbi:MAG: HD domain-containing protein [Candidatus Omnitrophica bacterium]|nr:HD domain-containing protein [Candidatus Omnitrophota bacterium]